MGLFREEPAGRGAAEGVSDWKATDRALTTPKGILFGIWRSFAALARPSRSENLRRLDARGESAASLTIRDATAADIPSLAQLHVITWNATHAPLLLKGPGYETRERQWQESFAKADPCWFCLVVERADGELVGFAQANRSDNPEFGGQLSKIYMLPEYQRLGLGKRLIGRVARRFLSLGLTSMWLFGDARNPSRRAWISLGAVKTDSDPGTGNYGWRDLTRLAALPD